MWRCGVTFLPTVCRQWVALTDITDEREGIQGYLKLSIVVLGPDDEQKVHTKDEEDDEAGGAVTYLLACIVS